MKFTSIRIFIALTLPFYLEGLLIRSNNTAPQITRTSCGKQDNNGAQELIRKTYAKLVQSGTVVSKKLLNLDMDGNGVLDCKELELIIKQIPTFSFSTDGTQAPSISKEELKDTVAHILEEMAKTSHENEIAKAQVNMMHDQSHVVASRLDSKEVVKRMGKESGCVPQCHWKCGTRDCDEVCTPKCNVPQCQTRCSGMSTEGCHLQCGQPRCQSVCRDQKCPSKKCPLCQTECSKPMCKIVCPAGTQKCEDVCETPSCVWDCKQPEVCPKPDCELTCDPAKGCLTETTFKEIPAPKEGETVVQTYEMPISLMAGAKQTTNLTLPVVVKRAVAVPGTKELKLEESSVMLPVTMIQQ